MKVLWTTTEPDAGMLVISPLQRALQDHGVSVTTLRLGPVQSPRAIRVARQTVRERAVAFDLVHSQKGSSCALASIPPGGRPFVVTLRGSDWNLYSAGVHPLIWKTRLARMMSRFAIQHSARIICVSHRMQTDVSRYVPYERTVVIPSPVDFAMLPEPPVDRIAARRSLAPLLDPLASWVLFSSFSARNPIKRIKLARSAIDAARRRVAQPVEFVTVTGLPHSRALMLTSLCDLILSTSTAEGWPNCVKEALACDVPFVATDTSDLHRIAAIDPRCRIVPPDPDALGQAIVELIQTPRNPSRPLRIHVESMAMPISAGKLLETYRMILNERTFGSC